MLLPPPILFFKSILAHFAEKFNLVAEKNQSASSKYVFSYIIARYWKMWQQYILPLSCRRKAKPAAIERSVQSNRHQIEAICSFPIFFSYFTHFSFSFSCAKQWKRKNLVSSKKAKTRLEGAQKYYYVVRREKKTEWNQTKSNQIKERILREMREKENSY